MVFIMKSIVLISTTFDKKEDAERIAGLLLEDRLIACAQISGPITSLYRWQGTTTSTIEFGLSLKTTPLCVEKIKAILHLEHPYDLPEILIQTVDNSSNQYSQWVYEEVQQ